MPTSDIERIKQRRRIQTKPTSVYFHATDDSLSKEASNNHGAQEEVLCSDKQRKMKLIETDMVSDLKLHIYPKMRNDEWKSFLMNIDANFQHSRVDQHSESFTDVFLLLKTHAVVSLGNYEKLLGAVKNIDVKAEDIIVKATKEIKAIQDSIPGIATREELEGQLTEMKKMYEDLKRQKEQLKSRNAECQRKYENVLKKRMERIKDLEQYVRSNFGPDCKILKQGLNDIGDSRTSDIVKLCLS